MHTRRERLFQVHEAFCADYRRKSKYISGQISQIICEIAEYFQPAYSIQVSDFESDCWHVNRLRRQATDESGDGNFVQKLAGWSSIEGNLADTVSTAHKPFA